MKRQKLELDRLLSVLPEHLKERAWLRSKGCDDHQGKQVLYWTHHALRSDENPALEVAIHLADQLGLPLLVYQGLSERYRFASDRHHAFILESARELEEAYATLGIAYALHVDREGARFPRLGRLVHSSAVVVTDHFPIEATKQWTERFAELNIAPVVLVDTACVVPSRLVGKAFDRAFAFRDATAGLYRERVDRAWPVCTAKATPANVPFETLKLSGRSMSQLIAECDIDHSVGPVADTRGGSKAGYARWQRFRKDGLRDYAKRRNQIEKEGVSRMSAYLHYGMVSPFRIAREASADGAQKYLDELLIWRELAYAFCHYRDNLETDASLPAWAVATLSQHANDPRKRLSWETLSRAKTGEPLWDAAQRSLLKHGELHNNVRMTWGKAILAWSESHRQALERLIDLNHRYALDGRDPASYGGILWCLGQFDRPFFPEQPILGSLRPRPVSDHQGRSDLDAYVKRVDRAIARPSTRVAMIGTGLAGLICSRTLSDHGIAMTCFEKSRRAGGRATTRIDNGACHFDHGAQYFTIRDPALMPYLQSWCDDHHVAEWKGHFVSIDQHGEIQDVAYLPRFVGTPTMESLSRHLSDDLPIQYSREVARVTREQNGYRLFCSENRDLGNFDVVLWNCPPAQVAKQLNIPCSWREELSKVEMVPCWAVMLAIESKWENPFDGAFINHGNLSWMARDSSKPSRAKQHETWVLHSTVTWASENLELSHERVIESLIDEAERVTGRRLPSKYDANAHRWLYSRPTDSLKEKSLWDEANSLGACGDWCGGPRVEGALKSGMALAGRVLGSLHERAATDSVADMNSSKAIQLELF